MSFIVWGSSEDSFGDSVLSYLMSCKNQSQLVRHDGKSLYPLSHLVGNRYVFKGDIIVALKIIEMNLFFFCQDFQRTMPVKLQTWCLTQFQHAPYPEFIYSQGTRSAPTLNLYVLRGARSK